MLRRSGVLIATLTLALAATAAQAPGPRDVKLVGDRFRPLTYDEMTPPQRAMIEHLLAGERAGTGGPFNVLLRSPELATSRSSLARGCGSIRRCRGRSTKWRF
jgi:hypothetical protein